MNHNIKRIVILLIGIISLMGLYWLGFISYGVSLFAPNTPSCKGCNVVIISLDTTRASELPCYGYIRNTMPNLCRFAEQNILFENAYSQSSWTFPSATSMMSGLYPSSHHMFDNTIDILHPSILTLPKVYKQAGYHTVAVINSQEKNIPFPAELTKQFDTVVSTRGYHTDHEIQTWIDTFTKYSNSSKPLFLYIYTTSIGYYRSTELGMSRSFILDPTFSPPSFVFQKQFTTEIQKDAITLIHSLEKTASDASSKALYRQYNDRLQSNISLMNAKRIIDSLNGAQQLFLYQEDVARRLSVKNPDHLRYIQNLYDVTLAKVDMQLSKFLDVLSTPQHQNNTITIIYSDHGENLGEHGLWGHAMEPFSTLTHVPLIMHIPRVPPISYRGITQLIDVFPTLVGITGINTQAHVQGKNLWPTLLSEPTKSLNEFTVAQLDYGDYSSIKTSQWLLFTHRSTDGATLHRLYDLERDPAEEINIASSHADVVQTLFSRYTNETNPLTQK